MDTVLAIKRAAPLRNEPLGDRLAIEGGTPLRSVFLPFCRPSLAREEEDAVISVLRSNWLTKGECTIKFEAELARYTGAKHAIALNSGTAALHLALLAAGVGQGDEVITTPMTFAATANMIVLVGATPVFVDVDPSTLNITAETIESAITPRTKALLPVHFAGLPCDMGPILSLAKRYGLVVIEDAAHALGAECDGRRVGSLGHFTCFSFYATKNITTGEGGLLTTDDPVAAERIANLALHGLSNTAWDRYGRVGYKHAAVHEPGFNYVMFDLQAALGLCQLAKLDRFLERRREITEAYDRELADVDEVTPLARRCSGRHAYHLYVLRLRSDRLTADRDTILNAIQAERVGLGVHFRAIHLQPYYASRFPHWRGRLPDAEQASEQVLSLPLYVDLTNDDVSSVASAVRKVIRRYRR